MHWVQCHQPEQPLLPRVRFLMNDSRRFNTLLKKSVQYYSPIFLEIGYLSFCLSFFFLFVTGFCRHVSIWWLDLIMTSPSDDWILSCRLPFDDWILFWRLLLMTGSCLAVSLLMTGSYLDVSIWWLDLVLSPFWWLELILTSSDDWILSCRLPLITGSYGDVSFWWLDLFLPSPFWWLSLVLTSPVWWMDLVLTSPF